MSSNKLKKNFDEFAIASIIENTKESEKQVIGWRLIGDKKVTVDLSIRVIRKFRDEIIFKATKKESDHLLQSLANGSDKLNFYFPEDMVLFQGEIKSFEAADSLVVKYPKMIAQIDRRKFLRLFLEDDLNTIISFSKENHGQISNSHKFEKRCFDLSAGGLSFIVSKTELKFFKIDDSFEMKLNFGKQETYIKCNIVNLTQIEPDKRNNLNYKGWKIAVSFEGLDSEISKKINNFVFQHLELDKDAL